MAELKNTKYEFEFEDGDKCEMTLAFYILYQFKTKNKSLYERYNKIIANGVKDEFDMLTVAYTAYLCANIDNLDECMSEEEFMIKCGSDRIALRNAVEALVKPKKQ
jgi:hypothetical protein